MLEPYAGKFARTVMRRRDGDNSVLLFDCTLTYIFDGGPAENGFYRIFVTLPVWAEIKTNYVIVFVYFLVKIQRVVGIFAQYFICKNWFIIAL